MSVSCCFWIGFLAAVGKGAAPAAGGFGVKLNLFAVPPPDPKIQATALKRSVAVTALLLLSG